MSKILRRLRDRFLGKRPESKHASPPKSKRTPLYINLGIDFGTSFTKVCYRDVGREASGIIDFGNATGSDWTTALIPSRINVGPAGGIVAGVPVGRAASLTGKGWTTVDQIKMRLASLDLGEELGHFFEPNAAANSPERVEVLAAVYLVNTLYHSKEWLKSARPDLLKDRDITWTANIGVPVRIYDSPAGKRFQKVLSRAWAMLSMSGEPLNDLAVGTTLYKRAESETGVVDCYAIPELVGSIQSLVESPSASHGVYIYFDIGGGTLDGVSFKFDRLDGVPAALAYSGVIRPLGVEAIASKHPNDGKLIGKLVSKRSTLTTKLSEELSEIQKQTGQVVAGAKSKDPRYFMDWLVQQGAYTRTKSGAVINNNPTVPILLGGGGKDSAFYRKAIESTWGENQLANMGIPPFELTEAPPPVGIDFGKVPSTEFTRFSVAYGLSIPFGEGIEITLPGEIPNQQLTVRGRTVAGHYDD